MAKAQRVNCFLINLEDRPGSLLEVMTMFKSKKVNLAGIWGFTMGPGQAQAYLTGKSAEKTRACLQSSGKSFEEKTAFFVKGIDKVGALMDPLQSLLKAGINIDSVEAIAVGGKFGSYIWVKDPDISRAEEALGAK